MGLDLTVLGKPLPGHEAEFHALLVELAIDAGVMRDPSPKRSLWQRLTGKGAVKLSASEKQARTARFFAIQTHADAALDAPRVGTDPQADAWVRYQGLAAGRTKDEADAEVARVKGLYALALLPPCDGLPVYSDGGGMGRVHETSFRGVFMNDCIDSFPETERDAAWEVMTAPELLAWGQRLQTIATGYATEQGLTAQLGQRNVDWTDPHDSRAQLHIVDSLARWAIFWGSRGHGSYPDF